MPSKNYGKPGDDQSEARGMRSDPKLKKTVEDYLASANASSSPQPPQQSNSTQPSPAWPFSMRHLFAILLLTAIAGSAVVLVSWAPEKPDPTKSPGYLLWEQATAPGMTDSIPEAKSRVKLLLENAEILQPDEATRTKLFSALDTTWTTLISYEVHSGEGWELRLKDQLGVVRKHCDLPQRGPAPPPKISLFGFVCFMVFGGSLLVGILRHLGG